MSHHTTSENHVKQLNLENYEDLPMMKGYFTRDNFISATQLQLQPDDVVLCTYPKSGTTWVQYIVWEILNEGVPPPHPREFTSKIVPFLEYVGCDVLKDSAHPWYLKYHVPYKYIPKYPGVKYIYIARNPKDCCVSYYYFLRQFPNGPLPGGLTFAEFCENFLTGNVPWGSQADHVLSWYDRIGDPNFLLLTYEELSRDAGSQVLKIADFLGDDHKQKLVRDQELFRRILHYSSFDYLKELPFPVKTKYLMGPGANMDEISEPNAHQSQEWKPINFFRKGIVGDWKNHFDSEMAERFDKILLERFRGTLLYDLWRDV